MEQKAMDEEQLYFQQKEKVGVYIIQKELGTYINPLGLMS